MVITVFHEQFLKYSRLFLSLRFFLLYRFYECGRDVSGRYKTQSLDLNDNPLLPRNPGALPLNALEITSDNFHFVAAFIMASPWIHDHNMLIVNACDIDKIQHFIFRDNERRILAKFIQSKMIVVIAKD